MLVIVFLIVSPFARTVLYQGNDLADHNHFAYLDALSLGCMAALIAKRIVINKRALTAVAITGWSLLLFVMVFRKWVAVLGLSKTSLNVTVLVIGTALVLIWMQKLFVSGQLVPSRFTGLLRFLGRNSYEVYLTHMFVVIVLVEAYNALKLEGDWAWALYISVLIFSGILGELVARYFSIPFNNRLRLYFKLRLPANKKSLPLEEA